MITPESFGRYEYEAGDVTKIVRASSRVQSSDSAVGNTSGNDESATKTAVEELGSTVPYNNVIDLTKIEDKPICLKRAM